ncbi:MAG: hypothetical protein IRY99_25875 [Isosphaeraceae bacterium]|nr:hypothetical protein [Isosphaeraceae bacterium]
MAETELRPATVNPYRSPSYPQRVHIRERAHWQQVLKSCDERIAQAQEEFSRLPEGPQRTARVRLLAQMAGARDQIADAAKRLPMEVGDLYEEDRHRLEEAVAALDRIFARWNTQR